AGRMVEAARTAGSTGYNRVAAQILQLSRSHLLAQWLHRRTALDWPLALALTERFDRNFSIYIKYLLPFYKITSESLLQGLAATLPCSLEQRDLASEPESATVVPDLIRRPITGHCITVNHVLIEQVSAFHQDAQIRTQRIAHLRIQQRPVGL